MEKEEGGEASPVSQATHGGEEARETKANGHTDQDAVSDPELEELLDKSLGEFGTHIPTTEDVSQSSSHGDSNPQAAQSLPPQELDDIFSEEFAAQAEAQLNEAMQMLASENPQMWQQLQQLAKSGTSGAEGGGGRGGERPSKTTGEASCGVQGSVATGDTSLESKLEETLKQLRQNTEQIESGATGGGGGGMEGVPGLSEMLGTLDLGSEEGEDGLMKVMTGMMDQLLSKDVLYPSLVDLCRQYPEWLSTHKDDISAEDYTRYGKQLEITRAICGEFESENDRDTSEVKQARSERILQLMQQLHEYGQPPEDLASENYPGALPAMPDLESAQNCALM